jgi:hypothetical protein
MYLLSRIYLCSRLNAALAFFASMTRLLFVTADEALEIARAAARDDSFYVSDHAQERGAERWASDADIRNGMLTADVAAQSNDGPNRWVLAGGCDIDGCGLRLVIAIDMYEQATVTVVTVYPT